MPAEHKLAVRDGERVREVLLVGTVTVGRSPACEISSPDPRLSRTHAAFDVVNGVVVVRDLGSRNGTTVNGEPITEHRLSAGDRVEVGPFIVQLVEASAAIVDRRPRAGAQAEDATVMMPLRPAGGAAPEDEGAGHTPAAAQAAAASELHDSSAKTRMLRRADLAAEPPIPAASIPAARETLSHAERPSPSAVALPKVVPPKPAPAAPPPPPAEATVAPPVRAAATELTFANAALLWIVPVVLISFLAGLVPDFMQPDERTPLLRAHYLALATSAVDLLKVSREPAVPIDNVTTALRGHAGVTGARIVGADGRILAPLDQAGTTVPPPPPGDDAPSVTELSDGTVDVRVAARTGDGRPVLVSITVDPERINPSAPGSVMGTLLLILSLGAAWLVARQLTKITDTRLSRLGEEVELMTTRQISAGRDPFSLGGGRRILDAVTFALSSAGRIAGDAPRSAQQRGDAGSGERGASASIDADAALRIVKVDRGCEGLLGINIHTAPGAHLIDVLPDQAVSNEVMRLWTIAPADGVISGEVAGDNGIRLGIDVTKGAGDAPLSIRFRRL